MLELVTLAVAVWVSWVDVDVEVGWADTDVEVSLSKPAATVSEPRSLEVLQDVLVLSLVDCWQNKVVIFFDMTDFVFTLFVIFTIMKRQAHDKKESLLWL